MIWIPHPMDKKRWSKRISPRKLCGRPRRTWYESITEAVTSEGFKKKMLQIERDGVWECQNSNSCKITDK